MTTEPSDRTPTAIDLACNSFMTDMARLSPTTATSLGVSGYDGELQDFTPAYWDSLAARQRQFLDEVTAAEPVDEIDRVTVAAVKDRIGVDLEQHAVGEDYRSLNVIASPVQEIRDTFLLMEPGTDDLRSRLGKVPTALAGYRESLEHAANTRNESDGAPHIAARRQVEAVAAQCEALARPGEESMLANLGFEEGTPELTAAKTAFAELADWLRTDLAPQAPAHDGVGRERYRLFSHQYVGDVVDLDEAYDWAQERLADLTAQQQAIVDDLYGAGTPIAEAFTRLDQDEKYTLHGTEALQEWMQARADEAVAELGGTHFDIEGPARTIEARIDPAGTGGIFYMPPTGDFSRPGRMYWSVPAGQTEFHTWQELTTVYHEGVPGHHLQFTSVLAQGDALNEWRRSGIWISGHGEGWALYAEQLMAELGYHDDPATMLGVLDAQRLRAARVVLDIGVHLGKPTPDGDGQIWDADYAYRFLRDNVAMDEANLRFELDRYLGWPGQAPSYALGQRLWEQTRDQALAQGMSLRDFHTRALAVGSVPMSVLSDAALN